MSKRHRNAPGPGHYKVQGHPIEDKEVADLSKQALVRETARRRRRSPPQPKAAPTRQPASLATEVKLEVPHALERAHDREFARMNERLPAARVPSSEGHAQPRYLGEAARGVIRRVARVAMAPLALARAVVDRFRDHD